MTPDQIAAALEEVVGGEVTEVRRLTGGASRETYAFRSDGVRLVLQRERSGALRPGAMVHEAALLRAAADAGVPVPKVVASGGDTALGTGFLVTEFVDGESIAPRIRRDERYAGARAGLAADCGRALARVHAIDRVGLPDLEQPDPLAQYRELLAGFGDPVPAFELALRWLADHRPAATGVTVVHGDFRLGNLLVDEAGLRAVIDWELAHLGDPMEDLGWLCVRAWRFGGDQPVAGVGSYEQLFAAYAEAAGTPVDPEVVRWWEVLGTLKWGVICIMQARAHLDGLSRSVELAAIGRRVCENEHDLLLLLAPDALARALARPPETPAASEGAAAGGTAMHGRPTAAELVEAVREWVEGDVRDATEGRVGFHARVAANVLATVQRELELGPAMAAAHVARLGALGVGSEDDLAAGIRDGRFDDRVAEVMAVVAETVVDKLRVANPGYA